MVDIGQIISGNTYLHFAIVLTKSRILPIVRATSAFTQHR